MGRDLAPSAIMVHFGPGMGLLRSPERTTVGRQPVPEYNSIDKGSGNGKQANWATRSRLYISRILGSESVREDLFLRMRGNCYGVNYFHWSGSR